MTDHTELLSKIKFDASGLVPAIAQEEGTGKVLMLAWMNADSIRETLDTGRVVYWSRSRNALWRKGDTSGHNQYLKEFYIDCDADTILLTVEQIGAACHTGEKTCFFSRIK